MSELLFFAGFIPRITTYDLAEHMPNVFWLFTVFVLGSMTGSFLNVVIHRLPRYQSLVTPPSHCPGCDTPIRWYHNLPLISWLWLKGKCAFCGIKISSRYFWVELLVGFLFLFVWLKYPMVERYRYHLDFLALIYWTFVSLLIAATFIDLEHYIIPDSITVGGTFLAFAVSALYPPLHGYAYGIEKSYLSAYDSILGILIGSGIILWISVIGEVIFRKEAMGFGDVKFMGLIGGILGWKGAVFTIFSSALIGALFGATFMIINMIRKKRHFVFHPDLATGPEEQEVLRGLARSTTPIPYGPYLSIGALVWMYFEPELLQKISDHLSMLQ